MRQRASILIGVLWCMALLAVIVVSVLHTARLDLTLARHQGDAVQAHYLALAGIEKAKALLVKDVSDRQRSNRSSSATLEDAPEQFRDITLGRGRFSVKHRSPGSANEGWRYGISDEAGRLNVNVASSNELSRLPGMTPDVTAAIMDWRDSDNAVTPGGAEAEYYASISPPHLVRNGPLQTVRELLMVRGLTPELFYGRNRAQRDAPGNGTGGNTSGLRDIGWETVLTVHSISKDVNAGGQNRVNVQTADERALTGVKGISQTIARALIAYRGNRRFATIADLLEVTPAGPAGSNGRNGTPRNRGGNSDSGGPQVISAELFQQIADDITVSDEAELLGTININTAGVDLLSCLPGVDRSLAQAIVNYRTSSGHLPNVASLLKVPGLNQDILKQILPRISARSETYRILAEGTISGRETRRQIEVVVRVNSSSISTLAYREDDL